MVTWIQYTSDIVKSIPQVNANGMSVSGKIAYRLYCDADDPSNVVVRFDTTYLHVHVECSSSSSYWRTFLASDFLGNLSNVNEDQLELNSQLTEDGHYVNEFAWPYFSTISNLSFSSVASCSTSASAAAYNGVPIFALANTSSLFSASSISYAELASNVSASATTAMWGSCFKDSVKFQGLNANNQSKLLVSSNGFDLSTSALRQTSTGSVLTYDEESSVDDSDLQVVSPYVESESFNSVQMAKSDLVANGLVKYDPDFFGADSSAGSAYLVNAYVVPYSFWTSSSSSDILRHEPEGEVVLQYEDFTLPEYDPPDPVLPIDDNTVFRLKKRTDSNGNVIVDGRGNPILTWVKCERIGQE